MRDETHELARLNRRIAEVRRCIEEAQLRADTPWSGRDRSQILALLATTLKAMEAQKAALEAVVQPPPKA
jgi:hypothetical protein